MGDAFEERGRALEDQFFRQKDRQLLDKFKAELAAKDAKAALAEASGINDDELLQVLVDMNIQAETLASLSLLPLVAVAWADGKMDSGERDAILKSASERGLSSGSPALQMVEAWLEEKPGDQLMFAWTAYVEALRDSLTPDQFDVLKQQVMGQAKMVAESAGGMLGMGNKISAIEKSKLNQLQSVFDGDSA